MLFKRLELSAPGKIILCGEHAVVYGKKALATAIDIRTYLTAVTDDEADSFIVHLDSISESLDFTQNDFEFSGEQSNGLVEIVDNIIKTSGCNETKQKLAIRFIVIATGIQWLNLKGLSVRVRSDIPLGSGLGSSASFAVCIALFFLIVSKKVRLTRNDFNKSELELINEHAFCLEKIFHGKPSGIDNTVSTYGGYISFQKGEITRFQSELDLLVLIVSSGMPKNTMEQVMKVKCLGEKLPAPFSHILSAIEEIVASFEVSLKQNNSIGLFELISMNHWLLSSLSVSNNELNRIVSIANDNGYSCKLTGGGGGGCCFAMVSSKDESAQLSISMKKAGFESFPGILGSRGVCIDELLV